MRPTHYKARAVVFELLEVSLLSMSVPAAYHNIFGLTAPSSKAENVVSINALVPVGSCCRYVGGVTDRVNENLQERTWLHNDKPLKKELKGAVVYSGDTR